MGIEARYKTRLMVIAAWLAMLVMVGIPSNLHASDLSDTIPAAPEITEGDSTPVTMSEDGVPTAFSLTLNATDADGGTLSWNVSAPASSGSASVLSTGGAGTQANVSYLPQADFSGDDSFVVRVADTDNLSDTITVNVTVEPINDAPEINGGDSTPVTMSEDGSPTAFSLTLSATDVENDTLIWSIHSQGSHGVASASGEGASKDIDYAPDADFFGNDSFDVKVTDTGNLSDTITINVTIAAVNDPPSFVKGPDQSVGINSGAKVVPNWATSIVSGPANESAQVVNFIVSADSSSLFSVQPAVSSDGTLTFTPGPNKGGEATVTLYAKDTGGTDNGGSDQSAAQTFKISVPFIDLKLDKTDGNVTASPGGEIVYTLQYSNDGTANADGVSIRETVPVGTTFHAGGSTGAWSCADGSTSGTTCTLSLGTLSAGSGTQSSKFAVRVSNPLTQDLTIIANSAVISTSDDEPNTGNNVATESTPIRGSVGVTASKVVVLAIDADGNTLPSPGDTIRYMVTVTHFGNAPAAGVVLSDTLDSNTKLVNGSVSTSAGSVVGGNQPGDLSVRVNIGTIGLGGTVVITYDSVINNPLPEGVDEIVNQAFVQGRDFPETPSDDPALPGNTDKTVLSLVAGPDLSATKVFGFEPGSGEDGIGAPGDTLVYTVTVVNRGNQGATSVTITDVVDSNTTLITGTVATTQGAITAGNDAGDTSVRVEAGTIDGGGDDVSVTFKVRINDTIPAGAKGIQNQADISADGLPDLLSDDPNFDGDQDPTFTSISADVNIIASMTAFFRTDTNMNNVADSGDELLYYVQIVNTGSRAAADAVYENLLGPQISTPDDAVNSDVGEVTAGNIFGSESVVVSLGNLSGGGEARISYRVVIDNTVGLPNLFDSGQGDSKVLTNQGLVRYSNQETGQLVEVLTDDPNQPGTEDKTPMIVHGADTIFLPMLSR